MAGAWHWAAICLTLYLCPLALATPSMLSGFFFLIFGVAGEGLEMDDECEGQGEEEPELG